MYDNICLMVRKINYFIYFIILFIYLKNNLGVPVSSWGTLEYNWVGLTKYRGEGGSHEHEPIGRYAPVVI